MKSLQELILNEVTVRDQHLELLSSNGNLESLLVARPVIMDVGFRHIGELPNLRELHLYHTVISGSAATDLGRVNTLETLVLEHSTWEPEASSKVFRSTSRLRFVSLLGVKMEAAIIDDLAQLPLLEHLDVRYSDVDDGMLRQLAGIRSLRYLLCSHTRVSIAGFREFCRARPDCTCDF